MQRCGQGLAIIRSASAAKSSALSLSRNNTRQFSQVHGLLSEKVSQFPTKDLLSVESQKLSWNLAALQSNSEALGKGLIALGFEGSSVVSALKPSGEQIATVLGGNFAGIDTAVLDDGGLKDPAALKKILSESKCKGLIISGEDCDTVYEAIPELLDQPKVLSETLTLSEFPSLKYIIQTGHETKSGMHRFKDILCYHSIIPLPVEKDAGILKVIASTGAVKESISESDLLAKAQEASTSSASNEPLSIDVSGNGTKATVSTLAKIMSL
mmetsp:Transcript_3608/g.4028  ORF Transcript_3608/g.4028 Transcript_3608/m.4028 type:complete len:269 (-) Transcript_3608:108-914(-)